MGLAPKGSVNVNEGSEEPVEQGLMNALFDKAGSGRAKNSTLPLPIPKPVVARGIQAAGDSPASLEQNDTPPGGSDEPTVEDLVDPSPEAEGEDQIDDDPEFDIPVDGEVQKVKLSKLKANYSGEAAIEARLQQVTENRKQAQQQAVQLHDANRQTLARLEQLNQHYQQFAEPSIDWNWLRMNNPQGYVDALERQRIARVQQEQIQQEAAQVQQRQEYLNSQAMEMYLNDQAEELARKLPDLADPNKSKGFMDRIGKAVKHFGYTPEELKEVVDHRVFVVLDYASRYLDLVQRKANLKTNGAAPSTTLRTANNSQLPAQTSKKREEAIINKARASGDPDDVAMTLLVPQRRSRG